MPSTNEHAQTTTTTSERTTAPTTKRTSKSATERHEGGSKNTKIDLDSKLEKGATMATTNEHAQTPTTKQTTAPTSKRTTERKSKSATERKPEPAPEPAPEEADEGVSENELVNEETDEEADEDAEAETEREELEEMKRKAKEIETRLADRKKKQAEKKMLKQKEKAEAEVAELCAEQIARIERLTKKLASVEEWKKELLALNAEVRKTRKETEEKHGIKAPPPTRTQRGGKQTKASGQQSSYRLSDLETQEFLHSFQEETWFIKMSGHEHYLSWSEADKVFFFEDFIMAGEFADDRVDTCLDAEEVVKLCPQRGASASINALVKKIFGERANANFRTKVRNAEILKRFR